MSKGAKRKTMSTVTMGNPQCSLPKNHEGDHQPEINTTGPTHKCVGEGCMWCESQCKYELVTFQVWQPILSEKKDDD